MSGAAQVAADQAARPAKPFAAWWLVGWALAAAVLIAGFGPAAARLEFSEPDNAMRLVQVRDLLAGQGWFDDVQQRLNPPEGVTSHWARWIDGAIAAPIAVLSPLVGARNAEVVAAFAWPLGLLAVFMMLVSRVCAEMAGKSFKREAMVVGPVVMALAFPAVEKFAPGSFDHHGPEMIFAFLAMLGLMRMEASPRWGAGAGVALAAALATAAEGLPLMAAGVAAAGVLWLWRGESHRRGLMWFGVGLAGASVVFFLLSVPPARWSVRVTDAMSPAFLGVGLAAGLTAAALGAAARLGVGSIKERAAAAGALSVMALSVLLLACPELLGGGYAALAPEMKTLWLPQISEARSLAEVAATDLGMLLAVCGSAVAGLVIAAVYLRANWRDANGWIVLAFLAVAWAVLAWQIRGAAFASAFAAPFGVWAIMNARRAWQAARGPRGLLVFAVVCLVSASAAWAAAGQLLRTATTPPAAVETLQTNIAGADACLTREAVAPLNGVAPGLIVNPFVTGPAILLETHHSVLAAPYHRDGAGIVQMMNVMRASPEEAKALLQGSPAKYVLACAGLPETNYYAANALHGASPAETLSARLALGQPPAWLEPVELAGTPLRLYRILK